MSEDIRAEEASSDSDDERQGIYGEALGSDSEQSGDEGQQLEGHPQAAVDGQASVQGVPVAGNPVLAVPVAGEAVNGVLIDNFINNALIVEEGQQPEGDPQAAGGVCNCQSCCDGLSTYFCCGGENDSKAVSDAKLGAVGISGTLGGGAVWISTLFTNPALVSSLGSAAGIATSVGIGLGSGMATCCVAPMVYWLPYSIYYAGKALGDKCCPPAEDGDEDPAPVQGVPVVGDPVLVGPVAVAAVDEIPVHEDPIVAPNDGPVVEEEAGQQPEGDPQAAEGGACNCQPCCDCVDTFYTCDVDGGASPNRIFPSAMLGLTTCVGTLAWQNASNPAWAAVPRVLGISLGAGAGASCVGPMMFWGGYGAYRAGRALKDKLCPPPAQGMAEQGNGGAYQALNEEHPGLQAGPGAQVMR